MVSKKKCVNKVFTRQQSSTLANTPGSLNQELVGDNGQKQVLE